MSLYLNWNGKKEDPFADMEDNWSDTASPNPFEIQASLIPNQNKFQYESARGLVKIIEDIVDSGSAGVPFSFLYFHGLVDREFDIIEEQLELIQLRSAVRFTFENSLNAAILRIMPGPEHEKVGFHLILDIVIKIASIPGHSHQSIQGVGAMRFKVPGVRSKEGDHGLHPDTRLGRDAWPSLMIEVGYSEGLNLLHLDARWWLINSQSKTRFVIIVKISRNPFAIHLECWRMAPTIGRQTRQTPAWSPTCVQEFHIDSDGVVVSPTTSLELRIPYDCIFDRPSPNAQPIMFSFTELSNFALRIFRMLE